MLVYGYDAGRHLYYRMTGKRVPGACVVFCYHAVPSEFRERFRRQMRLLRRKATILPADARIPLEEGKRYCMITFDDGFRSVFQNALPVLRQWDIPATIFFATDFFNGTPDWIREKDYPDRKEKIMSVAEMRQLDSTLVLIGSHTASHPFLPRLTSGEIEREFQQSREKLEEVTGHSIELLALPFGKYPPKVFHLARKAGYSRVFTNDPEEIFRLNDRFVLGRFDVSPRSWLLEIRLILAGAYRWLPRAFRLKRKIRQQFFTFFRPLKKELPTHVHQPIQHHHHSE